MCESVRIGEKEAFSYEIYRNRSLKTEREKVVYSFLCFQPKGTYMYSVLTNDQSNAGDA